MLALRVAGVLLAAAGTVQAAVFPRAGVCGTSDKGYIDAGTVCKPCGVNNRANGNGGNGCSPCYIGGQLLVSTPYPAGVPFAADPTYPAGTGCFCNSDKGLFGDKCKMCVGLGRVNGAFPSNACGRCITSTTDPKYIDPVDGSCKSIAGPCANPVTQQGNTIGLSPSPSSSAFFVEYPQGTTATACCQKCYSTAGCVGWVKPLTADTEFGAAFAGGYCLLGMNTSPSLFSGKECGMEGNRIVTPSPLSPARYEVQVGPCGRVATPTCGRDQIYAYPGGGTGACTACSSLGRASLGLDNACGECAAGATASSTGVCSCATNFEVHENACKACSTLGKVDLGQANACGSCTVTGAIADPTTGVCACATGFEESGGTCIASCTSTQTRIGGVCTECASLNQLNRDDTSTATCKPCKAGFQEDGTGKCVSCYALGRDDSTQAGGTCGSCVFVFREIDGVCTPYNLLVNPGFEDGGSQGQLNPNGWAATSSNNVPLDSGSGLNSAPAGFPVTANDGVNYFSIGGQPNPQPRSRPFLLQAVRITPGYFYKASVAVRASGSVPNSQVPYFRLCFGQQTTSTQRYCLQAGSQFPTTWTTIRSTSGNGPSTLTAYRNSAKSLWDLPVLDIGISMDSPTSDLHFDSFTFMATIPPQA